MLPPDTSGTAKIDLQAVRAKQIFQFFPSIVHFQPVTKKYFISTLTLAASVITGSLAKITTCESDQTVVCAANGNGGLLSLGNIASDVLGDNCSGGDVYCCSEEDVEQVRFC